MEKESNTIEEFAAYLEDAIPAQYAADMEQLEEEKRKENEKIIDKIYELIKNRKDTFDADCNNADKLLVNKNKYAIKIMNIIKETIPQLITLEISNDPHDSLGVGEYNYGIKLVPGVSPITSDRVIFYVDCCELLYTRDAYGNRLENVSHTDIIRRRKMVGEKEAYSESLINNILSSANAFIVTSVDKHGYNEGFYVLCFANKELYQSYFDLYNDKNVDKEKIKSKVITRN